MEILITKTERGFPLAEFSDFYNKGCSIQISSLADARCIWFGTNTDRMHLTQDQVEALLPILENFVQTGEIY